MTPEPTRTERSREAWMRYARKCAERLARYDASVGSRFAWRAGTPTPLATDPDAETPPPDPRCSEDAINEARKVARANGKHLVDDAAIRELARIYDR